MTSPTDSRRIWRKAGTTHYTEVGGIMFYASPEHGRWDLYGWRRVRGGRPYLIGRRYPNLDAAKRDLEEIIDDEFGGNWKVLS